LRTKLIMASSNLREIFDDISLSVMKYLENHTGVSKVQLCDRQPASKRDILSWQTANYPYSLPEDFKSFLLISDGLQLLWHVEMPDSEPLPIGRMQLNPLASVRQAQIDSDDVFVDQEGRTVSVKCAAFEIDSFDGRVVLFYRGDTANPQVWFQDLSCTWHYIANSFTDYFRLMVTHLGLPRWHYIFTATGIDPAAKQWFRFLAPERLAADLAGAGKRRALLDSGPRGIRQEKSPEESRPGSKLNWSQIERTSSRASKGSRRRKDEEKYGAPSRPSGTPSGGRPGSANRTRPSSAPTGPKALPRSTS